MRTIQKTMIPVLSRENVPERRKRPRHFPHFVFSSNSSNSSSPDALAHERGRVWKWFNHRTARRSTHCVPLYFRGQRDAACIWRFSSFFARRSSVRRHLQWRHSNKWLPIQTTVARESLLTHAAQQDCRAPCYVVQFGIGRKKKTGTFSLSLRQVVAHSFGWIDRVCAVTHLVLNDEWTGDNDF